MRSAIVKEFNTFYRLIITFIKRTEEHFKLIHSDILNHLGAPATADDTPKPHSIFSNLPSGLLPKIATLRHRLTSRILNYLTSNFSLPRGWTLLIISLYSLLFILLLYLRTTIMVSGQWKQRTRLYPITTLFWVNYSDNCRTNRQLLVSSGKLLEYLRNYTPTTRFFGKTTCFSFNYSFLILSRIVLNNPSTIRN